MNSIVKKTVILALLMLATWAYSLDGGLTKVVIQANGNDLKTLIDGKIIASLVDNQYASGKISIKLFPQDRYFSFTKQKVSSVILKTKFIERELLDNDCKEKNNEEVLCEMNGIWDNFELIVTYHACHEIQINVREQRNLEGYTFWARTWMHRDFGWRINSENNPSDKVKKYGIIAQTPNAIFKSILYDILPSLKYACLILAVLSIIHLLSFKLKLNEYDLEDYNFIKNKFAYYIVFSLSILTFIWLCHLTIKYLEAIPHVQDSVAYWFQAKIFAAGKIYAESPKYTDSFDFPFLINHDGKLFSQYPFGWPLTLALGHFVNAPWVIPGLIGCLNAMALFWTTRKLFNLEIAIWSCFFLVSSLWFQMMASNFMSHNFACLLVVLSIPGLINLSEIKKSKQSLAISGIAIGLLLNTRPLTAVAVTLPFIIQIAYGLLIKRKLLFKNILNFSLSCSPFIFLYFFYNFLTTGSAFKSAYNISSPTQGLDSLLAPFGEINLDKFTQTLIHIRVQLGIFKFICLSLPPELSYTFFIVCLALKKDKKIFLLTSSILSVLLLYSFHPDVQSSIMYGPRYIYEILPIFIILTAIGWHQILIYISSLSKYSKSLYFTLSPSLIILLVLNLNLWLGDVEPRNSLDSFTPLHISQLKGFNGITGDFVRKLKKLEYPNIVFVAEASHWQTYGQGFFMNNPDMTKSKIWIVRNLGTEKNQNIINLAPERKLYKIETKEGDILPY